MAYLTNLDIEQRLGHAACVQLADDDGDGQPDAGVVDEARLGAEGELNSYLARRYEVPIDLGRHPDVGDLLKTVALDLAEYRLRLRRPPMPDDAAARRQRTTAWLARVADGRVSLPASIPIAASSSRGTVATVTGATRRLSDKELESF